MFNTVLDCRARIGEQRIVCERHAAHSRVTQSLLGNVSQTERATLRRIQPTHRLIEESNRIGLDEQLAGKAAINVCWPLPAMPAMPTISPLRTSNDTSSRRSR